MVNIRSQKKKARSPERPLNSRHKEPSHSPRFLDIGFLGSSSSSPDARTMSRKRVDGKRKVIALFRGLLPAMRSRPELSQFSRQRESAKTLYRYGRNNLKAAQDPKAPNLQHFMADVRKENGFRSLPFIYDLFDVSPPPKRGRNINDVEFVEPNIPRNLRKFNASFSSASLTIFNPRKRWLTPLRKRWPGRCLPATIQTICDGRLYRTKLISAYIATHRGAHQRAAPGTTHTRKTGPPTKCGSPPNPHRYRSGSSPGVESLPRPNR